MPDPTNQKLADIMLPLFEREPELRPTNFGGNAYLRFNQLRLVCGWEWQWDDAPGPWMPPSVHDEAATQLCESSMVRWLGIRGWRVCIYGGANSWIVDVMKESHADELSFSSSTLVEALTKACTAVLDAKEQEKEGTF